MESPIIETSIKIKASLNNVWRVFTDQEVTEKIGGHYETDWKVGNAFGFRNTNGDLMTQGILMEFSPKKVYGTVCSSRRAGILWPF